MSRRDTTMIVALSLIWGASFMFIRVADRQFDPAALVWFRVLLGCVVLVPVALIATGRAGPEAGADRLAARSCSSG